MQHVEYLSRHSARYVDPDEFRHIFWIGVGGSCAYLAVHCHPCLVSWFMTRRPRAAVTQMMLLCNLKLVFDSSKLLARWCTQSCKLFLNERRMNSLQARLARHLRAATKSHHLRSYLEDLTFPKTGSALVVSSVEAAAFGRLLVFLDFPDTMSLSIGGKSPVELFRQKQRVKPAHTSCTVADVVFEMVGRACFPAAAAATIASVLQTILVRASAFCLLKTYF